MDKTQASTLHPALLPLGTNVGPWRVVGWGGQGVYGAVYQAVRAVAEPGPPVALKLALLPRDPRFARERELLSRVEHPSIPRLLDSGEWHHPLGTVHPYIVMEWVDGTPLYEWVQAHHPAPAQEVRLLAQTARALEALHAQGAIHRDVKGGNVLVRRSDGRAMLMDFGSGIHAGAATLTPPGAWTGTPAYRSAESSLFSLRSMWDATARYDDKPTDDLYALGVTAYRLITGTYPELSDPFKDEAGIWQLGEMASPPPSALAPQIDPQLDALIVRMLRVRPEARGTAREIAKVLEQVVERLQRQHVPAPVAPPPASRVQAPTKWLQAMAAAAALLLSAWAGWAVRDGTLPKPSATRLEAGDSEKEDANTVGLGDAALKTSTVDTPDASIPERMAEDALPAPREGQAKPNARGQCPHKEQLALNGGCWVRLTLDRVACEQSGYVFTSQCYGPVLSNPRHRHPTSDPSNPP
ncbi:serine/threonine-protein kinase [Stigmatella aurantiaca]|uniref:Protein kinase n=1 Tax=Stigmatella aurantiaca (strain DW4/3-1) TaxID=378806 RepID=Q099H3_STIAD|nr:serine/threonine-protein kinase [Stigmatella aurantiaca]ADO75623.1 Protein kinase [Stigmatella aurantiaca DW4/3-1]EAU68360.1 protein kinase [Stigmatella aurantiaca DW4/3-1]